jgi:hypothetical protein
MTPMATNGPAGKTETVRARIARAAEENYATLECFFQDALHAEKTITKRCDNSHRNVTIPAPDWAARDKVVNTMLIQGFGRPPTESAGGAAELVVIRRVVLPDGTEVEGGDPGQPLP